MDRVHNQAEVIIGKQRHGPTGSIPLFFEAEFIRFDNLDLVHDGHDPG
jgi:replicative DNA helicase